MNTLQQQARFDAFISKFNDERPHEALAMKLPAERYAPSSRPYHGLPDLTYPFHNKDIMVTACGRVRMRRKKMNISTVLAGQGFRNPRSGRRHLADKLHAVRSRLYRPGQRTLQTMDDPLGRAVADAEGTGYMVHVSGAVQRARGQGTRIEPSLVDASLFAKDFLIVRQWPANSSLAA